ncbi:MAG TPA: DUF4412 domain-containing protein [Balneolaceae bacterium]|nr:DUF4412 domain-containing protein [Balneolaceae bacterium]
MTKKNVISALLLGVFLISGLQFPAVAQNFEGVIYYQVPEMANQGMGEMPYMIKGSKARMEFGQGNQKSAMLFLPSESKIVMIIEAMKGYMSMDYNNEIDADDASQDHTTVTKTGEMKTIAGRSCEVWNITSDKDNMEVCMAKGLGNFMIPQNPMSRQNTPAWAQEIMDSKAMPLEVLEINGDGSKTIQMKASRIEEKTLSPELFEIPKGYNDMSAMLKQMQNQGNQ